MKSIKAAIGKLLCCDWTKRYVLYPVPETAEIETLVKAQLNFILYKIDSPMKCRLARGSDFETLLDEQELYDQECITNHKLLIKHTIHNN